jgi:hypothetical protein
VGLVRGHPGTLLAHEKGEHLELRVHRGRHASAVHGRLDLAHGAGEDRDQALVVTSARTALAALRIATLGITTRAWLTLGSSSHELLLERSGHVHRVRTDVHPRRCYRSVRRESVWRGRHGYLLRGRPGTNAIGRRSGRERLNWRWAP